MPRVRNSPATRKRRKKVLRRAKGYVGGRSKLFKTARETVDRAASYAYRDRKQRKRLFRRLWITRIGAAARLHGISYNKFMHGLKTADIDLDRKTLAEIAKSDPEAIGKLAELAREQVSDTA